MAGIAPPKPWHFWTQLHCAHDARLRLGTSPRKMDQRDPDDDEQDTSGWTPGRFQVAGHHDDIQLVNKLLDRV